MLSLMLLPMKKNRRIHFKFFIHYISFIINLPTTLMYVNECGFYACLICLLDSECGEENFRFTIMFLFFFYKYIFEKPRVGGSIICSAKYLNTSLNIMYMYSLFCTKLCNIYIYIIYERGACCQYILSFTCTTCV